MAFCFCFSTDLGAAWGAAVAEPEACVSWRSNATFRARREAMARRAPLEAALGAKPPRCHVKARPRESHALFVVSALCSLPHGRPPCRRKIITMELLAVPEGELTSHLQAPHPVRVAATPWAVRLVAGTLRRVDTLSKEATTHRPRSRRTVACRQAVVATMAMRLLNQCISSVRNKAVVMQHRAAVPAWPRCSPAAVSKSSAWPFCTRYTPPSNKAVLHSP